MAKTVFRHPPLIEIAAEVRWDIPGAQGMPPQFAGTPMPVPDTSVHEMHFMNFAGKAGARGFGLVERVIPAGFPLFAHQVAFRYRNTTGVEGAPIFQIGPGVFSINIVPPYKSWEGFLPYIDLGLTLLLESRSPENQNQQFTGVRLRYLDAFGEHLRQGKSIVKFLAENLGMKLELPPSITKYSTGQDDIKPAFSIVVPMQMGTMELKVGEGWVRNALSVIVDTTVICNGPLGPDKAGILSVLNAAHDVIHESFVGMTGTLHQLMELEEEG